MWRHIVIEGYCFGEKNHRTHKTPCGQRIVSSFCLNNGHCPHFAYAVSTEREAAFFVPLHLILRDRLVEAMEIIKGKLEWYLWDKWHYDDSWIGKMPIAKCPAWDKARTKAKRDFGCWLKGALKEEREYSG